VKDREFPTNIVFGARYAPLQ